MAVFLPGSGLFVMHIPRTGGTTIRHALVNALNGEVDLKLPRDRYRRSLGERHHISLQECPPWFLQKVKTIACFVRHPFDHYESLWRLLRARMDKPEQRVLWERRVAGRRGDAYKSWSSFSAITDLWVPDFQEWVERVLDVEPGFTTRLYEQFVGLHYKETCDFIGRTETMLEDVAELLDGVGYVDIGVDELGKTRRQHRVKRPYYRDTVWTDDLRARVAEAEKVAIRRFYGAETRDRRWYNRVSVPEE